MDDIEAKPRGIKDSDITSSGGASPSEMIGGTSDIYSNIDIVNNYPIDKFKQNILSIGEIIYITRENHKDEKDEYDEVIERKIYWSKIIIYYLGYLKIRYTGRECGKDRREILSIKGIYKNIFPITSSGGASPKEMISVESLYYKENNLEDITSSGGGASRRDDIKEHLIKLIKENI